MVKKAKILIRKGRKEFVADLDREVTVVKEKQFFIEDLSKDFSTTYGSIRSSDLKKTGVIKSSQDKEFRIFDASFIDMYKRMKRIPQIIPLKDIGFIIAKTGVGPDSIAIEGGSGSGALAMMLGRLCRKVYSYEIEKEHFDLAKENAATLGIKNIVFHNSSLYDKIVEKNADILCLDVPEPWKVIEKASKALKAGGFIVSYSPTIIQTADFVNALLPRDDFVHLKTVEVIEREWEVEKRKVRPRSKTIIHSGFISIGRKI